MKPLPCQLSDSFHCIDVLFGLSVEAASTSGFNFRARVINGRAVSSRLLSTIILQTSGDGESGVCARVRVFVAQAAKKKSA